MILTSTKPPGRAYALASVALGLAALAFSLPDSARLLWDARYLMLAFCALTAGTRVYIKIPYAAGAVPLSASLVLLAALLYGFAAARSEEHTSELQSQSNLVCRLLLEKKKKYNSTTHGRR